jgi:hypothetical protein
MKTQNRQYSNNEQTTESPPTTMTEYLTIIRSNLFLDARFHPLNASESK